MDKIVSVPALVRFDAPFRPCSSAVWLGRAAIAFGTFQKEPGIKNVCRLLAAFPEPIGSHVAAWHVELLGLSGLSGLSILQPQTWKVSTTAEWRRPANHREQTLLK
jgi:hypothetical protein